jgi:hypothetical protein
MGPGENGILLEFFEGDIPEDRLKTIAFILFGNCNGIYHWYDPLGSVTHQHLSEMIGDIVCGGIKGYKKKKKAGTKRTTNHV